MNVVITRGTYAATEAEVRAAVLTPDDLVLFVQFVDEDGIVMRVAVSVEDVEIAQPEVQPEVAS